MKTLNIFISILFLSLLSSPGWSATLSLDDMVERNELYYKKFTNKPFSGKVEGMNGTGKIRKGKKHGTWEFYYQNGQLLIVSNYKNGIIEGTYQRYHENGMLHSEGNYVNGKKDGYWKFYKSDGSFENQRSYLEGKGTLILERKF
jgi:multimeric flavodoxin WrbA